MEAFKIVYTLLGGLGIFFYGMKSMSEALQSIAGDMIKKIINTMTKNRVYSVVVGMLVTVLVQSSSVTTVMVVGFVNAGLMNLTQAIGVIFGANIGTTVTGWIISIKVGKYGLLFIGAGIFPMLFGKSNKMRQIGRVLFGIGMIFFGLKLMSGAFKPLRTMPEFLDAISYFSEQNYGSYMASIIVGCLLTIIIQSSSAMLGITISLALTGVIQFHTAAALVLGENIGTTITALLASVGGNVMAKRTARAHAIFNLFGVGVIFSIFPIYVRFIDYMIPGDPAVANAAGEFTNVAIHIASGHTIFNITATLVFLPFVRTLAGLVTRITPDTEDKEQHHLVMLGEPRDMVVATALATARAETNKMKDIVDRAFVQLEILIKQKDDPKKSAEVISKINHYERITDNIQKEVTVFLVKLLEGAMNPNESQDAHCLARVTDELESVCDYLAAIANITTKIPLNQLLAKEAGVEYIEYFDEVKDYYESVTQKIVDLSAVDIDLANLKTNQLREKADLLREAHMMRAAKGEYEPNTTLTYSDLIVNARKVRSHTHNIAGALHRARS